jgi:hypothetical protein
MKVFAFLLVLLIFERRLSLDRGIMQPLQITELAAARAIGVILQGRLTEHI